MKQLKKTSMQKSFHTAEEDEENQDFELLLNEMYGNDPKARRAMDQHMALMDAMAASDTIKECEKH